MVTELIMQVMSSDVYLIMPLSRAMGVKCIPLFHSMWLLVLKKLQFSEKQTKRKDAFKIKPLKPFTYVPNLETKCAKLQVHYVLYTQFANVNQILCKMLNSSLY